MKMVNFLRREKMIFLWTIFSLQICICAFTWMCPSEKDNQGRFRDWDKQTLRWDLITMESSLFDETAARCFIIHSFYCTENISKTSEFHKTKNGGCRHGKKKRNWSDTITIIPPNNHQPSHFFSTAPKLLADHSGPLKHLFAADRCRETFKSRSWEREPFKLRQKLVRPPPMEPKIFASCLSSLSSPIWPELAKQPPRWCLSQTGSKNNIPSKYGLDV